MTPRVEPTAEQLQRELDVPAAAAPGIWPTTLAELADNAAKYVAARAEAALADAALRATSVLCTQCAAPAWVGHFHFCEHHPALSWDDVNPRAST